MIVLYIMSNGTPEENLKQIFRVFDINNDGTITLKVLDKFITILAFNFIVPGASEDCPRSISSDK